MALREVEFEWEEVEGAKHYQVEIKNSKDFHQTLNSNTNTFKIKIAPGRYQIRGKVASLDVRDTQSDWSNWKAFDVPPATVAPQNFNNFEHKISAKSYVAEVPLQWLPIEGASEYILNLSDANGKLIKTINATSNHLLLKLRPGYYAISISARTWDGLLSEPVTLPKPLIIQNIPMEPPQNIVLDTNAGSLTFTNPPGTLVIATLERRAFLGKDWIKINQQSLNSPPFTWKSQLKPGNYRVTAFTKNAFNEVSVPVIKEFIVKPKEQDLPE